MGVRAVVVQHVDFEGPGLIGAVLSARGADLRVVRTDEGDPLPAVGELDVLVVMGGPMGAHDDSAYPHLAGERELLAAAVAAGLPVLGVCLGAQLLAAALGGTVSRGRAPEVGLGTVGLTDAGRADPVLGPAGRHLRVLHWHTDTFTLPAGAVRLAGSPAHPNQGFRVGSAYGLQFHVEVDSPALDALAPHLPAGVELDRRHAALVTRAGRQVLTRWAEQLPAAPAATAPAVTGRTRRRR